MLADLEGQMATVSAALARLGQEASKYALARATHLVDNLTERLTESADNGGLKADERRGDRVVAR
jgi:hypothetical protein